MRIPFRDLSTFSTLFEAYCQNFDAVSSFYAADYRDADLSAIANQVAAFPRNRAALVATLLSQNAVWGMDEKTRANIEALTDADTLAIVTGQQVGLFGGALYTPLKTITTLQLAQKWAAQTGRRVVPVFWLEGEDHDLAEVNYIQVQQGNDWVKLQYSGHELPENGNLGPVGRLSFTAQIEEMVNEVETILPPTAFKPELMAQLRDIFKTGTSFHAAFVQMMKLLFPDQGLIFVTPDDPALKRLSIPLFEREIKDSATLFTQLQTVSEDLKQAGYHAQVHPRSLNLFWVDEHGRYAIDKTNAGFRLKGREKTFTPAELLTALYETPENFSPNVVLRPQMQDWLFPTLAYIGGPGEIAYFAQFKPVYTWSGIPMPYLYPRASATVIEGRIQKVLQRYNIQLTDLTGDFETLFKQMVLAQSGTKIEDSFQAESIRLNQSIETLKTVAVSIDPSMGKATEALRASLQNEIEKFKKRLIQAEKRNHEGMRDQVWKARTALFPDGLQERKLSVLPLLNKYGLDLMTKWLDELSLDTDAHQVLMV